MSPGRPYAADGGPKTALELHPLCALFPALQGSDFETLREDICAHGQRQSIVLLDGQIADGDNRYCACLAANIELQFENFTGTYMVALVFPATRRRLAGVTPGLPLEAAA